MTRTCLAILAAISLAASSAFAEQRPRIAIIIDDLGYEWDAGRRAIELPGALTYAILPGGPRARSLAEAAKELGKEVLLHLPLQAMNHEGPMEPGGITLDMSRQQFSRSFDAALESVPYAVGVNNHRGSLLTRHPGHMRWLMEDLQKRDDLFFVDSFTTHHSVALQIAEENGIPAARRDVFLDNDREPDRIRAEFERLMKKAQRKGYAIGIGHPYPQTLEILEEYLPEMLDQGFELVPVSELINTE